MTQTELVKLLELVVSKLSREWQTFARLQPQVEGTATADDLRLALRKLQAAGKIQVGSLRTKDGKGCVPAYRLPVRAGARQVVDEHGDVVDEVTATK